MYKLCNILKFVIDGFYDRSFAQQNLVIQWHELVFHIAWRQLFYKVKDVYNIILLDSFDNEPKREDSKNYTLKKKG